MLIELESILNQYWLFDRIWSNILPKMPKSYKNSKVKTYRLELGWDHWKSTEFTIPVLTQVIFNEIDELFLPLNQKWQMIVIRLTFCGLLITYMVSQVLFLRILNFFNRFAACFDLLKTDFLFKNQNEQKNANITIDLYWKSQTFSPKTNNK